MYKECVGFLLVSVGLEARVIVLVNRPAADRAVVVICVEPSVDAALVKAVATGQTAEYCVVVVHVQTYGTGATGNHTRHRAVEAEAVLGLCGALFGRRVVLTAAVSVHETHNFSLVFICFCCTLEPPHGQVFDVVADGDGGLEPEVRDG